MIPLLLRLVSAFLLVNILILYVPPSALVLAVIALVGVGALFIDHRKLLPLAISLSVITLLFELVVRAGGIGITPYFRPHEMLALERSYRPGRTVDMQVPHGDLLTIDPRLPRDMAQPRHEVFVSDANGYRNDTDYAGETLILVGDSFLVGTDTTLTGRLRERFGRESYNVSFSGSGPLLYAEKIAWARSTLATPSCVVSFYFEGNDFRFTNAADLAARDAVPGGIQDSVRAYLRLVRGGSEWSKVFYGLLTRSAAVLQSGGNADAQAAEEVTFVRSVGGRPMGFLKGYAEVTRRPAFEDNGFIAGRLRAATPDLVVFVPDKYRVYEPLLDEPSGETLPHAQWAYLKQASDDLGIQAVDLTPHLVERSRQIMADGNTTFWRDDTHWNRFGEDVAAEVMLSSLEHSPVAACRRTGPHD